MAVTSFPLTTRLQLRLRIGIDEQGNPILRNRSYSNLKPEASNAHIYQLADGISGLQAHQLEAVRRIDEVELVDLG